MIADGRVLFKVVYADKPRGNLEWNPRKASPERRDQKRIDRVKTGY